MSQPSASTSREVLVSRSDADRDIAGRIMLAVQSAGLTAVDAAVALGTEALDRSLGAGAALVALVSPAYVSDSGRLAELAHVAEAARRGRCRPPVVLRTASADMPELLRSLPCVDLVPLLDDSAALDHAVRGAVAPEQDASAAQLAALLTRVDGQVVHPAFWMPPDVHGRAAELDAIATALWSKGGRVALVGADGTGRTALARSYAWANRARYAGIWMVRAGSRPQSASDVAALGARLIPGLDEMADRARAVNLTLDAVTQSGTAKPWLVVVDDAAGPDAVAGLTPPAGAHLVVTTPWQDWHGRAEAIPVGTLPREEAAAALGGGEAAGRIADALGGLPLAVAVARATAAVAGGGPERYAGMLSDVIAGLPASAERASGLQAAVELALRHAQQHAAPAAGLLGIAAHLASSPIPLDMLAPPGTSASDRDAAVATLVDTGLCTRAPLDDGSAGIAVHPWVQSAIRARLDPSAGAAAATLATRLVAEAFPDDEDPGEVATWPACERIADHARAVLAFAPETGDDARWTSTLLGRLGAYAYVRADYETAGPLMQRALALDEARLGRDHPDLAIDLGNLAELARTTGRPGEAEPLLRRALAITEASNGPDHPSVAGALGSIALLLGDTDRAAEAEPLMRRALEIDERHFGTGHPQVAADLVNLAGVVRSLGRTADAETLMRRALAVDEAALGADDPSMARDLGALASMLQDSGRFDEAEPMLRRSIEIAEQSLGEDHPAVATSLNSLAVLLHDTGRNDEALPLMRRALAIDEAVYGPEHPTVALRYGNYAEILFALSKPAEADPYIRHAFLTAEKTMGKDNPTTWSLRASYDKIIAAVDAIARKDDAVEVGLAPAPPERLSRLDIPPPPEKPGIMRRLFGRRA